MIDNDPKACQDAGQPRNRFCMFCRETAQTRAETNDNALWILSDLIEVRRSQSHRRSSANSYSFQVSPVVAHSDVVRTHTARIEQDRLGGPHSAAACGLVQSDSFV